MNLTEIREQLLEELTWRKNELSFFESQLVHLSTEDDQEKYRKALVVMLYSHFEGFFKSAFLLYKDSINQEHLKCSQVNDFIVVCSLLAVFKALENPQNKSPLFKKTLPDDTEIHKFFRRVEFVGMLDDIDNQTVNIPDEIVDTESNLKPIIIKKILYQLGLPYEKLNFGKINKLLGFRNAIAHGAMKDGVKEQDYKTLRTDIYMMMLAIVLA